MAATDLEKINWEISARDLATRTFEQVGGGLEKLEARYDKLALKLGAGLSAVALTAYVQRLVDSAEQISKVSDRTGIAVGRISELRFAAELGDVSFESLTTALGKFNVKLVEGQDKTSKAAAIFRLLGVDITQGPSVAITQFAERASKIEGASTKTAVFKEVLGKTGDALIPVFANLEETDRAARALGITMEEKTAKQAERLNDSLKTLRMHSEALAIKTLEPVIGAFSTMADNIARAAERGEKWTQVMREAVKLGAAWMGGGWRAVGLSDAPFERIFNAFDQPPPSGILDSLNRNRNASNAPAPDTNALNAALNGDKDKTAAELKLYTGALQQLEEKLGKLNAQTEEEIVLSRVVKGSWKELNAEHAVVLLNLAVEFDERERLKRVIDEEAKGWKVVGEELERYASKDREALERTLNLIDPSRQLIQELQELDSLYKRGKITIDQYGLALDAMEAKIARSTERQKDAVDEIGEFSKQAARNIQSALGETLFDVMEGRLSKFAGNFVSTINRMVSQVAATKLGGFLFGDFDKSGNFGGVAGNLLSGAAKSLFGDPTPTADVQGGMFAGLDQYLGKNALGGDYVLGGAGGTDSQLVGFHGTPGERVSISPPGKASGGATIYAPITIVTPNPSAFNASRGQISSDMARMLQRAQRDS